MGKCNLDSFLFLQENYLFEYKRLQICWQPNMMD